MHPDCSKQTAFSCKKELRDVRGDSLHLISLVALRPNSLFVRATNPATYTSCVSRGGGDGRMAIRSEAADTTAENGGARKPTSEGQTPRRFRRRLAEVTLLIPYSDKANRIRRHELYPFCGTSRL